MVYLTSVEEITNGIEEAISSDNGLNFIQIIQQTSDIGRILALLYGLISTIIYIVVPLIVSLELIYICFPVIREKLDEVLVKVEGKGIAGRAIGFSLRDAREAVFKAETVQTGRSALWVYLKLKFTSLLVVMFVIFLVLNGSSSIINFVWTLIKETVLSLF